MIFTKEQECYILNNYIGITTSELAASLNKRFHTSFTRDQIKNYLSRQGLKNGVVKRFKKGHIPANKGKKMPKDTYEKAKHTMFKKGNVPPNIVPIGTEKLRADGYIWVKVQNGKLNKNWKLKHVLLWEKDKGPLPKDKVVTFLDGDSRNFGINNLKAISKATNARLNQNHLRYNYKELTEAGIAVAEGLTTVARAKRRIKGGETNDNQRTSS